MGDFEGTLARTAESEAITEAIGNPWQLGYGRMLRMRLFLPDALRLKGLALTGLGRREEGRRVLGEARAEADRMGSRRVLWHILASLAELADPDEAEVLRQEAREIVQVIANHVSSEQLRASFLSTAQVRALFAYLPAELSPHIPSETSARCSARPPLGIPNIDEFASETGTSSGAASLVSQNTARFPSSSGN